MKVKLVRKIKSKNRSALSKIIIDNFETQFIKNNIRFFLKNRSNWRTVSIQKLYDDLAAR